MNLFRKVVLMLLGLAIGLSACGSSTSTNEAAPLTKIRLPMGYIPNIQYAPFYVAVEKGYFKEAGLDIELKFFDAAQPIAVATTSGDVDFGITAFTAGLYNLAGKGTLKDSCRRCRGSRQIGCPICSASGNWVCNACGGGGVIKWKGGDTDPCKACGKKGSLRCSACQGETIKN